ncbi:Ribosomal protein [Quillaja saponaria]|uniref:Ribosomal protein n=1 Tax=Quillaja saponaria TaxID=32244 RepID=A0AAD7VG63_QUISA|nr:Ribosomal protein [Quillaja saponaria]KAJ7974395.1 Ribosomal protein [Quillaja saponaria]
MVYFHSSISVCKSVDQSTVMADSISKPRQTNHLNRNRKIPSSSNCLKNQTCHRSRSAAVDVVILIAVICACGFLLFPYIKFLTTESIQISRAILYLLKEEVSEAPLIYGSIGLSIFCAALATWVVVICTSRKCGNPNCKGLGKAAEFDIQLETEECVKKSTSVAKDGVKKGLFELPRDHHRELEAELKKMAPPNGRAVLIFRARCGCSVGRLEVPGPKKLKKIKK